MTTSSITQLGEEDSRELIRRAIGAGMNTAPGVIAYLAELAPGVSVSPRVTERRRELCLLVLRGGIRLGSVLAAAGSVLLQSPPAGFRAASSGAVVVLVSAVDERTLCGVRS